MGTTDPGSAREEAERLVATLLAGAKMAAAAPGSGAWGPLGGILSGVLGHTPPGAGPARETPAPAGFATGSPECCVCPVCRGIAALRDPSPEFAERLATGAGDLAPGWPACCARSPRPNRSAPPTTAPPRRPGSGDHVWRRGDPYRA
nr:hypothetical protein [Micromonospora provocatoris]